MNLRQDAKKLGSSDYCSIRLNHHSFNVSKPLAFQKKLTHKFDISHLSKTEGYKSLSHNQDKLKGMESGAADNNHPPSFAIWPDDTEPLGNTQDKDEYANE